MSLASRIILICVLCFTAGVASAGKLKIKEEYDDFTKETYLRSKNVTVCQPHKAGMVPCATLRFEWRTSIPEMVIVHFEISDYLSLQEMAFNIDGVISSYDAESPITDRDYDSSVAQFNASLGKSSSNIFVVPLRALKGITESEENGIFRISGTDGYANFDFYRKASFGGLPVDKLRDLVERVQSEIPDSVQDVEQ